MKRCGVSHTHTCTPHVCPYTNTPTHRNTENLHLGGFQGARSAHKRVGQRLHRQFPTVCAVQTVLQCGSVGAEASRVHYRIYQSVQHTGCADRQRTAGKGECSPSCWVE